MERAYYIDRIRIWLIILVIFHHSAIAFGASGGWYYLSANPTTGATQGILSLCMTVDQAFFMSFFFFISALFTPRSYDKKGASTFVKDRLIRLGIPLIIYILLIHPTVVFIYLKSLGELDGSWLQLVLYIISNEPTPGPMWFVLALIVFELLYVVYRVIAERMGDKRRGDTPFPGQLSIFLFIIFAGLLAFGIRLIYPAGQSFFGMQFGYFALYILMYIVGLIASRNDWLNKATLSQSKPWFYLTIFMIVLMEVVTLLLKDNQANPNGGLNGPALIYACWEPFVCVGVCFFSLMLFKSKFNKPNSFVLTLSTDSFVAYIIHPLVVVSATLLADQLPFPPIVSFVMTFVVSAISAFLLSHLIRKVGSALAIVKQPKTK